MKEYLGFDPFNDPALGRPLGNERVPVVLISSYGYQLRQKRLAMRLPRKALAEQLRRQAHDALAPFGEQALRLREIADLIVQRKA